MVASVAKMGAITALGCTLLAVDAAAQGTPFPIRPGIAVATRMGAPPSQGAATVSPEKDGVVVGLYDVSNPGGMLWYSLWLDTTQGGTMSSYSSANWTSEKLGQIFGVTLGDPDTSDFFVAATGIYGSETGKPYYFAKDSFQGDMPGAVWRLNPMRGLGSGGSDDFELVANIKSMAASLGQITYNHKHRVLYVSSMHDGMIHALVAPGNTTTPYTPNQTAAFHTYQHIPTAGLVWLTANDVDSGTTKIGLPPSTHPMAPYGNRIWAVAYEPNENRVYYSVVNSDARNAKKTTGKKPNEIWSVAVDATGRFLPGTARLELKVPYYPGKGDLPDPSPALPSGTYSFAVSDIAFTNDGQAMVIAERGELIGRPPLVVGEDFTGAHLSRIMTFALTLAGGRQWLSTDPSDPLASPPGPYGVFNGAFKKHTNSAGGVDFGDGYTSAGPQADVFVWSTVNSFVNRAYVSGVFAQSDLRVYGAQGISLADAKTRALLGTHAGAPAMTMTQTVVASDPPKLFLVDLDREVQKVAKNQVGDIAVRRARAPAPIACNCATVESHAVRERTLFARVCTPTLKFSEIRVVQGNVILVPSSITPTPPASGAPPYCADIEVQLTGTATQVQFELTSEADAQTFVAQCCRSPAITVTLPRAATANPPAR